MRIGLFYKLWTGAGTVISAARGSTKLGVEGVMGTGDGLEGVGGDIGFFQAQIKGVRRFLGFGK
jgi:hypothetical protein